MVPVVHIWSLAYLQWTRGAQSTARPGDAPAISVMTSAEFEYRAVSVAVQEGKTERIGGN